MISSRLNVSVAGVIFLIFLPFHLVASLQVTSGSSCASACVSTPHLGTGSSYGLACKDEDFLSKYTGQLYQSCLTCLQKSSFSKDDETDQQWFLYHLRSLFDSCIFDHLDDQGSTLNSCVEDNACGGLDVVLKSGTNDPTSKTPDGYCSVNGSTDLSHSVETCLNCVQSSKSHKYLSNFLVAIKTGCENKPSPGTLLGLSNNVFSESLIQNADQSSSDNVNLNPGAIAGIVIGVVTFLLLIFLCIFFLMRRRQRSPSPNRSSLLSFRCQTRVTPRTPRFPPELVATRREMIQQQRAYIDPGAALNSNPVTAQWHAPANWYTTPSHTPSSSTTALVSPPPTAYFATNITRSPEQEPHSRSASSSISSVSSISSLSVSSRDPLIRPRTESAEPPEYSSIDSRPPRGFIPGLAISTPGDTALYTGQNIVQKSLYSTQRGYSYQPWGSRRGRYRDTPAENQPTGDDLDEEKSSPVILPSEFSPFQVSQPPPPARKP